MDNAVIKPTHALYLGDSCELIQSLPDESIDFMIFSPPFSSLYTYSNSERDLGNCKDYEEFAEHYAFLTKEMFRVVKPGRLISFHCMQLPFSKERDGFIGLRDFRGNLIRMHERDGFIYHSEVCIWKDPVISMQRTKALGLLHKQIVKDSAMSRQGVADYLVTMRKPGVNENPIKGEFDEYAGLDRITGGRFSIEVWQRYASPVWMDIDPSDTLQRTSAREDKDERHIAPLQLQVIHRALQLWSLPGDVVLSPFAGIGSEGFEAVKMRRKFVGFELKRSYFDQAVKNIERAVTERDNGLLFSNEEETIEATA